VPTPTTDVLTQFVVVRSTPTDKILTVFSEVSLGDLHPPEPSWVAHELQSSELQAEKRGNFVVIGCIEGPRVVSWSFNVSIFFISAWKKVLTWSTYLGS
jgi:hypothetical protein